MVKRNDDRAEAIKEGRLTYHGRPCKNCSATEKYTKGMSCVACMSATTKSRGTKDTLKYRKTEKGRARGKEYRLSEAHLETQRKWQKNRYAEAPDVWRNNGFKSKYGITLDDYNAILASQDDRCKICQTHSSQLNRALAVDHCHSTGEVRGLLCNNCNTGLGKFKDDPELLSRAIEYLK